MDLALRAGATAGVALVAAGLVAVTPVAAPALPQPQEQAVELAAFADPVTNLQEVASVVYSLLGDSAFYSLYGAQDIVVGLDNALVVAPQMLFSGLVDTLVGQTFDSSYAFYWAPVTSLPTTLSGLVGDLQNVIQVGQEYLTQGLSDLSQGVINAGLFYSAFGLDYFMLGLPQEFAFGALSVLGGTLGL